MPNKLAISRRILRSLSREQLLDIQVFIGELLKDTDRKMGGRRREASEQRPRGEKTYRLVLTRCGKPNCKCATGTGHGPYWYAFWSEGGRTQSQYVGKKLSE